MTCVSRAVPAHFKRHILAINNEKDIQTPGDVNNDALPKNAYESREKQKIPSVRFLES